MHDGATPDNLPEHTIPFRGPRRTQLHAGAGGEHVHSTLAEDSMNDWSLKGSQKDPGYALTRQEIDAWVASGRPRIRN